MNRKRSILLTAGAVLAASLLANATTPAKSTVSNETTSTDSTETKPAKPGVCNETKPVKRDGSAPVKPAICDETTPAESATSDESTPAESTVSSEPTPAESVISSDPNPGAFGSPAPDASSATTPASRPAMPASTVIAGPRSAAVSQSTVSPKLLSPHTPVPSSSDPQPSFQDSPDTVLTPEGLATTDTILSYCGRINPNGAQTYQTFMTAVTQGHDSGEISGIRMDPEYAKTQGVINSQLAKVPFGSGMTACRSLGTDGHGLPGLSSPIHTKMGESD